MWPLVLIDSCVMIDAMLKSREQHVNARRLLQHLFDAGATIVIPSHAYFECATSMIIHFKRESDKLNFPLRRFADGHIVQMVTLDGAYAEHLIEDLAKAPIPDLKSSDLIYFCIARDRNATLITEDRKLRNTCRKGGLRAFEIAEALQHLDKPANS